MTLFGSRILILAPHPDDEVVACAATIARARAQGAALFVLYLTNGIVEKNVLWPWDRAHHRARISRRLKEAEIVAKRLGVKPISVSDRPARAVCHDLPKVFEEIQHAVQTHRIDQLWIPAYEGGHPDHDAINGACALFPERFSILEFAEYNYANGRVQTNAFPTTTGTETLVRLTDEEKRFKAVLLGLYASERRNLDYVGTVCETFRPLAIYDYAKPPHKGTVWYARFHWVPFSHPRIDRTKPAQVSAAITALAPLEG